MKTLILIALYAALSWPAGVLAYFYMARKKRTKLAIFVVCTVLYGGPPAMLGVFLLQQKLYSINYRKDVAFVQELCAKYGGDKVYRTVENVEDVFQMQAKPALYENWGDQFGMVQPWAVANGDRETGLVEVGRIDGGYWFMEQQPPYGQPEGPPYRRTVIVDSGKKVGKRLPYAKNPDDTRWTRKQINVNRLRSKYGYRTEDIGTEQLRRRWIGAGRIEIIDLQSNEVIAERVGYFRASGPQFQLAWTLGTGCQSPANARGLHDFLRSVLRPPDHWPSEAQLKLTQEN